MNTRSYAGSLLKALMIVSAVLFTGVNTEPNQAQAARGAGDSETDQGDNNQTDNEVDTSGGGCCDNDKADPGTPSSPKGGNDSDYEPPKRGSCSGEFTFITATEAEVRMHGNGAVGEVKITYISDNDTPIVAPGEIPVFTGQINKYFYHCQEDILTEAFNQLGILDIVASATIKNPWHTQDQDLVFNDKLTPSETVVTLPSTSLKP